MFDHVKLLIKEINGVENKDWKWDYQYLEYLADTEISYFHSPGTSNQQVVRFDVTMNYILFRPKDEEKIMSIYHYKLSAWMIMQSIHEHEGT